MARRNYIQFFESDSEDSDDGQITIHNRSPKVVKTRTNYYETLQDQEFFKRFRLTKPTVYLLHGLICDQIQHKTQRNNAVSPMNQLLLTLRFYALGSMLIALGDFIGVSTATASQILKTVSSAIALLAKDYIKLPETEEEIENTKLNYFRIAKFPKVLGALDCTHVRIQSPGGNEAEIFRNRKGYFSINVQVVVNADLLITDIVARWPGSAHDSNIFMNSRLRARLERGDYKGSWLLGDSAYPLKTYLMTPLDVPSNKAERLYNESQIRTRNVIERCFGVWKRRFPVLSLGLRVKLQTTMTIIVACAVLHNIAQKQGEDEPPPETNITSETYDVHVSAIEDDIQQATARTALIQDYFAQL